MAVTRIADVIVPEVYDHYSKEVSVEKSAFVQSGIMVHRPELDILAEHGGGEINKPFWRTLKKGAQVWTDSTVVETDKITADKEVAVCIHRIQGWSANDFAAILAGSDPMGAIISYTGGFWTEEYQETILAVLRGIFSIAEMADSILDLSDPDPEQVLESLNQKTKGMNDEQKVAVVKAIKENTEFHLNARTFIKATAKKGDARNKLTTAMVHSAVGVNLEQANLIDTIPEARSEIDIKHYLGRRIIEDDGCPAIEDGPTRMKYVTYIFGAGVLGLGLYSPDHAVETGRDKKASEDYLINRRSLIIHPAGFVWSGKLNPSNEDLANGENWKRVAHMKNVPIIKIVSNG